MAHTMTTSEFANYIFNRFANAYIFRNEYCTNFQVIKRGCMNVLSAYEPKSGMTKVTIYDKPYSKMTAAEKREALEFVNTLEFDMVVDHDIHLNQTQTMNYISGSFTEGEEINIYGTNEVWRRIEKVTKIQ